ncbi:glutamate--cysteine ligase family protein [Spirochaeta dissipatitropha]
MHDLPESGILSFEGNWGVEREAVRTGQDACISRKQHPADLDQKYFSKDFSESQLEIVSSVQSSISGVINELSRLHATADAAIGEEFMWPSSMPPIPNEYSAIYPAVFPRTREGEEKEAYRRYLQSKYGSAVMHISGVHVNFSYSDEAIDLAYGAYGKGMTRRVFTDQLYLKVAAVFLEYLPLSVYVFGASPEPGAYLNQYKEYSSSNGLQNAVSLRNSHYGYRNPESSRLNFDTLRNYTDSIRRCIGPSGLFSEKEVYAPLRLKPANPGKCCETSLDALDKDGISYIEMRIPDLNPYSPIGIDDRQLHFLRLLCMHAFIQYCSVPGRNGAIAYDAVIAEFEDFALNGADRTYREKAESLCHELFSSADMLDSGSGNQLYSGLISGIAASLSGEELLLFERVYEDSRAAGSVEKFMFMQAGKHKELYRQISKKEKPSDTNRCCFCSA